MPCREWYPNGSQINPRPTNTVADQHRHRSKILGVVQPFIEPTRHGDHSERSRRSQQPQDNRHRATRAPLISRSWHDSPHIPHRQVTHKVEAAYRRAREQPQTAAESTTSLDAPLILSPEHRTPSRRREKQPQPSEATRWGRARAAGPTGAAQSPMDRHSFAMRPTTSQRQRLQQ